MNIQKITRFALAPLVAAVAFCFCGCGTVEGFGEDLQKVGRKLENASEEVQYGDGGRY